MQHVNFRSGLLFAFLLFFVSCNKVHDEIHDLFDKDPKASKKVYVDNINRLYAAVNDSANRGKTIVLAPGTYMLNPNNPNGGRLDLLKDMSLLGQQGHPESVIIDASALPRSSVEIQTSLGTFRTGVIRTGNGNNAIEWMTLQSNGTNQDIRSLIQTDIVATPVTRIRVAHTIVQGAGVGINIANRDTTSNGRTIEAEIEDNEVRNNNLASNGFGIFIQSQGASNGTIRAVLKRNYIHGNQQGLIANQSICRNHKTIIESHNDRIEENGIGVGLRGGVSTRANTPVENNVIRFSAFRTDIRNNQGTPQPFFPPFTGGVYIAGGVLEPVATPGTVNNNRVEASFTACRIEGNVGVAQITAFGAHSTVAGTPPVGTNNVASIYLSGISRNATVSAVPSIPLEPAGTNRVDVVRQ
ncbi:MAG: hypothetical protein M3342_06845 [Bacteroidota bacterium]|nr:hypothetical protein [Bacteroidota bacterium]